MLAVRQRKEFRLLWPLNFAQWKSDRESRPAFKTIGSRHTASVNTNDCFHEGKSKSMSPRCTTFHSSLEEMTIDLRVEAGPIVFHGELRHVIIRLK